MSGERKTWLVLTRPAVDGFNPTRDTINHQSNSHNNVPIWWLMYEESCPISTIWGNKLLAGKMQPTPLQQLSSYVRFQCEPAAAGEREKPDEIN